MDLGQINWTAYQKGYDASVKADSDPTKISNPHTKGTVDFFSWNKGWNSHYPEEMKSTCVRDHKCFHSNQSGLCDMIHEECSHRA